MPKFTKGHPYHPRSELGKIAMKIKMSGERNPAKRLDVRLKISKKRKGISTNLGRRLSEEVKRKMSDAKKGRKQPWAGKHLTDIGRKILSESKRGEKNPNWKGGITSAHEAIRNSLEYKLWREAVFKRDGFICIWCGRSGYVEADHIKPFAFFPELRFSIDNGRTLCRKCHDTTKNGRPKLQRDCQKI